MKYDDRTVSYFSELCKAKNILYISTIISEVGRFTTMRPGGLLQRAPLDQYAWWVAILFNGYISQEAHNTVYTCQMNCYQGLVYFKVIMVRRH